MSIAWELIASLRGLLRRPFYPALAVSILSLGLTAAIAVFTYINGFYQPFPGADSGRLIRVFELDDQGAYQEIPYLDYLDYATAAINGGCAASMGRRR